jgi:hypothetical protein
MNFVLTQDTLKPARNEGRLTLGQLVSRAQKARPWRCFPAGNHPILIAYHQMAIQTFLHLDPDPGIAGAIGLWEQLKGPPLVFHRIVPSYLATVLEAENGLQIYLGIDRAVGAT